MNFIALDISTKTGIAFFKENEYEFSTVTDEMDTPFSVKYPGGKSHPEDLLKTVQDTVNEIIEKISKNGKDIYKLAESIDFIGIEQTNLGKDRYKQKLLEWIHYALIQRVKNLNSELAVLYIDTSEWRKILGLNLTKEIRAINRKTKRKKERGKITLKHLSVNYVNEQLGTDFRMKDEDECEAICIGFAFLKIYENLDQYLEEKEKLAQSRLEKHKQKRRKK